MGNRLQPGHDRRTILVPTLRFGNPFLWTSQRYDAGVGLYHFPFRSYSPRLGRWLQRDPLGYVDGVNLYQYVASMPTRLVDLWGLDPHGEDGENSGGGATITVTGPATVITLGGTVINVGPGQRVNVLSGSTVKDNGPYNGGFPAPASQPTKPPIYGTRTEGEVGAEVGVQVSPRGIGPYGKLYGRVRQRAWIDAGVLIQLAIWGIMTPGRLTGEALMDAFQDEAYLCSPLGGVPGRPLPRWAWPEDVVPPSDCDGDGTGDEDLEALAELLKEYADDSSGNSRDSGDCSRRNPGSNSDKTRGRE